MAEKKRILFVCLGNIIRSPLAEGLFKKHALEAEVEGKYEVDSAGTGSWHVGEPPDPRMVRVAARYGCSYNHVARQFQHGDFDDYDLILAMDPDNRNNLRRMARTPEDKSKIHLLREFDPNGGPNLPVPDPYYGGIDGFDEVYKVVDRSTEGLLRALENGKLKQV
ncbi:MAG: low molecular weight phosphotyrosine protein phosphatase [Chloroflexi bacterium]|nr:MAG: low molecular weight phosphotyrosine protein phosphatase [Chloroflexota bacterium]